MNKLKFNPDNAKYYSEEFIKGFNCGVERQFNADMEEKTTINSTKTTITDGDLISRQTANKININEYVKVRLTDYGKEIFYHQYDDLNKFYGKEMIKPSYPTVDSDGYTSFQLWYFINLYGRYIDMGVQNVIEPLEIVFESAEKTAEWIKQKSGDELFPEEIVCSKCYHSNSHLDFDEHNNPIGKLFLKSKYCPNCGAKMTESEEEE